MARAHPRRTVKICKVCGEGYDAFRALDARGRYCSPGCLEEARRRHRSRHQELEIRPVLGSVIIGSAITLGGVGAPGQPDAGGAHLGHPNVA